MTGPMLQSVSAVWIWAPTNLQYPNYASKVLQNTPLQGQNLSDKSF